MIQRAITNRQVINVLKNGNVEEITWCTEKERGWKCKLCGATVGSIISVIAKVVERENYFCLVITVWEEMLIMYHYKICGLNNIYLQSGYTEKDTPSGKAVSIQNVDDLHKAISLDIVNQVARLSRKEFKFLRLELDLSQKALGLLMDKKDQTIALWEKGEQEIPVLADKAIRDLYTDSIESEHVSNILTKLAEIDRKRCEEEANKKIAELNSSENQWILHSKEA